MGVLEIDPEYGDVHQIGLDLGGAEIEKYSCICAAPAPCEMLYAAPRNAHHFIEICPRRAYVREVGNDHGRCLRKFSCIVPGVMWQGGMLWEDYKVIAAKKEEDYQRRLSKFEARRGSYQASLKAGRRPSEMASLSPS